MEGEGSSTQPTPAAGPFLSGIILAAGRSIRMGRPKQLLPLGRQPLLQNIVNEAAGSCLDEIILVLGYRAEEILKAITSPAARTSAGAFRVIVNPDYEGGQSASLRAGMRAADPLAAAAASLLGDQPGVTKALIDRVAAAFLAGGLPVARPVYSGPDGRRIPGHPVFLARPIWADVEQLCGDEGARALLHVHPEWLLEVPVTGEPPCDIDTWDDYQRLLTRGGLRR